jgi:hypothetical protein
MVSEVFTVPESCYAPYRSEKNVLLPTPDLALTSSSAFVSFQADFEMQAEAILLPQPPMSWYYRRIPLCPAVTHYSHFFFFTTFKKCETYY